MIKLKKEGDLIIDGASFSEFQETLLRNKEIISCKSVYLKNLTVQHSFAILELLYKETMDYQYHDNSQRSDEDTSYGFPIIYLDGLTYSAAKACVSIISRINEKVKQQNGQPMRGGMRREANKDVIVDPSKKRIDSPIEFKYENCFIDTYTLFTKRNAIKTLFSKYTPPAFNDSVIVFEGDLQQWSALSSLVLPFVEDADSARGINLRSHIKNDSDWYLRLSTRGRHLLTMGQRTKHMTSLCYVELKSDRLFFHNEAKNEFILPKDAAPEAVLEKFLQFLDETFGLKNRITLQEDVQPAPSITLVS